MIEASRRGLMASLASLVAAGPAIAKAAIVVTNTPVATGLSIAWSLPRAPLFVDGDLLYNGVIIREQILRDYCCANLFEPYRAKPEDDIGDCSDGDEEECCYDQDDDADQ